MNVVMAFFPISNETVNGNERDIVYSWEHKAFI
jgi:hypothetical protein